MQASRSTHWRQGWARLFVLCLPLAALGQQPSAQPPPLPSFAELEAAGARVGEIRVRSREIFDTQDPLEDKLIFRWANALHIQTRPGVIESALLFKTGEPLSVALIDETERVLRSNRYLYDVQLRPVAWHDGVADIEVETRDTWSFDPGFSAGRSGGVTSGGVHIQEYNLLGTGAAVSLGTSKGVDRRSDEFQFSQDRVFGSRAAVNYSLAQNSDGRREAARLAQPFYSLDTRWAAGVSASKDTRIDAFYNAGEVASQYRHHQDLAEVFAGWSAGRVDAWVQRYSLGWSLTDDAYAAEPGLIAPAKIPSDEKLAGPFVRYELIEDRFEKLRNRNLIERPEFFALGLAATAQLGWASTAWGASLDALLYRASISRGFEPAPRQNLNAAAAISGQFADGRVRRQHLAGAAQYYLPQGPLWLLYAAASGDVLHRPEPVDALQLGGDNGLRGYPLRYQSGYRRMLFTLEERRYTDLYVWQLFRIGGAAFLDVGRAWGGDNVNLAAPGWLGNGGVGLRIVSARSAFSNVLHLDLAFPFNAPPDIKKVQFLFKTKASF